MDTSKRLLEIIDQRVEKLEAIGQEAVDNYWSIRLMGNKEESQRSNLGCRLKKKGTQFSISWFFNTYNNKPGEKADVYSKHIKKGRSTRYPPSVLQRAARSWELEDVLAAENIFAAIREELETLGKMRRGIARQRRLAERLKKLIDEQDGDSQFAED